MKIVRRYLSGKRGVASLDVVICLVVSVTPFAAQSDRRGETTEKRLAEARSALDSDDLERSADILRKLLQVQPRNWIAHTLAGVTAARQNNIQSAERHFSIAVKLNPTSAEPRNNHGAILLRLGRKGEASREFAASLRINPRQLSALVNLGRLRFEQGDLTSARSMFERAQAIQNDKEISRSLLLISLRLKDIERAKLEYSAYASFGSNASDDTDRAELAAWLLQNGQTAEAAQELRAILEAEPSNVNALLLLARATLQQKDIPGAGKLLEGAIARGVDDARLYAGLADVYLAGGYFENAIPAMRLAIEKAPTNDFYRARYGLLLIDSKAPSAAIIRLQEALKELPDSPRIWLALGIAQQIDGKPYDAKVSFERVLRTEPKSVPALAYLATLQSEQGQYAEAAATYKRALAIDQSSAILHYLLADTLLKMPASDPAVIMQYLTRSVELDPTLGQAHFALGKLHARSEDWTKALVEFEQTVRYSPEMAEGYYQLGRVLARLKRVDESKAAFEKHKKLGEEQSTQKQADRQELVRRLANVHF